MPFSVLSVAIVVALALAAVVAARALHAWLRFKGKRRITCPENQRPAGVVVDAGYAALTAVGHKPELRLSSCSRWPERAGCGQQCLSQVKDSPEDCLVRNILNRWYAGKECAQCGLPFEEIHWAGAQPALIRADKVSVEWTEVAPEEMDETLKTAQPVCFACHMAKRLVREHPEIVVNRSGPRRDDS